MKDIFTPADILLPKEGTDMTKWAAVAGDQFSAQPEYWEGMDAYVGDAPSALRLMLPEAYLNAPDVEERKKAMAQTMKDYMVGDVFERIEDSYIFVERTLPNGKVRRGLVGKLDLEAYDWTPGSASPVRSTEATVPERLPTRVSARCGEQVAYPTTPPTRTAFNASLTAAMIAPNPVTLGLAVGTGLAYAGTLVWDNWDGISKGAEKAADWVGDKAEKAGEAIKGKLEKGVRRVFK